LQEMLAWTQILLVLVLVYGAQMMFRDRTHAVLVWGAFPPSWTSYVPSTWLADAVAEISRAGERTLVDVVVLFGVMAVAGSLIFHRLGRLYQRVQPAAVTGRARPMSGRVGQVGGHLDKLIRRREERIGFWLCRTLLARETGLKLRCLWPLNMAAAVVIVGLVSGQFANPLRERDLESIALPALAVFLLPVAVPGIVYNLCSSREHQAVWLLLGAPLEEPAAVARGMCKAVVGLVMAPACVLLGLLTGFLWQDPLAGLLHAGLAWALCWPLALVALWLVTPDVPFSLPPVYGGALGRLGVPLALLNANVVLGTALHCLWAGSLWYWVLIFPSCWAAGAVVQPQADRRSNRLWRGQA
jgi:hypothetical protein